MNKLVVYLAGGTARICKMFLHLISAGTLNEVKSVDFIIVDSDSGNRDTSDVKGLIESFNKNKKCFGINCDINCKEHIWDYKDVLRNTIVATNNVNGEESLHARFVNPDNGRVEQWERNENELLLKSQFSNEQMYKDTNGGFFGFNNVAATFLGVASKDDKYSKKSNNQYAYKYSPASFLDDIINTTNETYKIIICASLFGGTGSALLIPLAKEIGNYIRTREDGRYVNNVKIGCTALLPYFCYNWRRGETSAPNPDEFYDAAYNTMKNINALTNGYNNIFRNNNSGLFDRMYFLGNEELENTPKLEENGDRGDTQRNNMTVTDYVAASSIVHFANENNFSDASKLMYYDFGDTGATEDETTHKQTKKHITFSELPFGNEMMAYGKFCLSVAYLHRHIRLTDNKNYLIAERVDSRDITKRFRDDVFKRSYDEKSEALFGHCKDFIFRLNEINNGKGSNDNTINKLFFGNSGKAKGVLGTRIKSEGMSEDSNDISSNFCGIFSRIENGNASDADMNAFKAYLTRSNTDLVLFDTQNAIKDFKVRGAIPTDSDEAIFDSIFCKLFDYIKEQR